jgi:hypothetical protein
LKEEATHLTTRGWLKKEEKIEYAIQLMEEEKLNTH